MAVTTAPAGGSGLPLLALVAFLGLTVAAAGEGAAAAPPKYKDPRQPVMARVRDLISRMTLAEKIGQMTQIERSVASPDVVKQFAIGVGGHGQRPAEGEFVHPLGIPIIYGIDAVHGHNNVFNATIFPHNVALGGPELVKKIGAATALEVRASGIQYTFAPCIAVCRDPRWGRCYESYSEDPEIVQMMTEIIPASRAIPLHPPRASPSSLASGGLREALPGDGGTQNGVNEGNAMTDLHELLGVHMPGYYQAVIKGVSTIMVSYSSWNGRKMHANGDLITGFLKNKLHFRGFVISDWQGIDRITSPPGANYTFSVEISVNAGLDMIMVPFDYQGFIGNLTYLVNHNFVNMSRIDDAVERILRVKFTMGLFENPLAPLHLSHHLGATEHRELAREAVRKSLVLLKNGGALLPLPKKVSKILVTGSHADNLGYQCGGWSIEWQGLSGNDLTTGTTILAGIRAAVDLDGGGLLGVAGEERGGGGGFSFAVVAVGETPYAETKGDSGELAIAEQGRSTVENACAAVRCVVVLVTGRPVAVEGMVAQVDALVAAWLPGTEGGGGIADVLFGDYGFSGKLARTWFRSVDQLPMNVGDPHYDPLFPFGFGLSTEPSTR
ncbi:unnamed protein product [Spirodela intermedia]|uniref:beta-glucosidase n=1 Tax=Spirodela intermedia TaxID=51605 RepID=A0A7I8I7Y7_SPIIN|nr:unnamed protein product [Spirodela intermedia]CAA6653767.1 unnamed protein product [Spirodela intermedia]